MMRIRNKLSVAGFYCRALEKITQLAKYIPQLGQLYGNYIVIRLFLRAGRLIYYQHYM
jgi:hypothetical protein